jgi:hypothetical protein
MKLGQKLAMKVKMMNWKETLAVQNEQGGRCEITSATHVSLPRPQLLAQIHSPFLRSHPCKSIVILPCESLVDGLLILTSYSFAFVGRFSCI